MRTRRTRWGTRPRVTGLFRPPVVASSDLRTTSLGLDEALADRVADELDAVAHPELAQDVRAVRLHRLLRQVQRLRDRLVRVRLGDQLEDLLLARRQWLGRPADVAGDPLADHGALDGVGD